MKDFTKVVRPGRIILPSKRPIKHPLYCKIIWEERKLDITGVIGPTHYGNAHGGCGQINMEFAHRNLEHNDARCPNPVKPEDITFAIGWNTEMWYTFLEVWKEYHLNGLSPACKHQRAFGWHRERYDLNHPPSSYGRFQGNLYSWNLKGWMYPPAGYLTKPCPICGYKFGTAWRYRKVPKDVLKWLRNLPDSDRNPPWV